LPWTFKRKVLNTYLCSDPRVMLSTSLPISWDCHLDLYSSQLASDSVIVMKNQCRQWLLQHIIHLKSLVKRNHAEFNKSSKFQYFLIWHIISFKCHQRSPECNTYLLHLSVYPEIQPCNTTIAAWAPPCWSPLINFEESVIIKTLRHQDFQNIKIPTWITHKLILKKVS
jgi:hypothetical protein